MVKWGENARIRAITDDFTGLYNRRFFDEALVDTVTESVRSGIPLTLVILDLDRFGLFNTEYGESAGDEILLAVVPVFVAAFENEDILARYGGDEFAFLLPGKDGNETLKRCRKAGAAIRGLDVMKGRQGSFSNITASIGIAECPGHGRSPEELLDRADKALYAAKEAGRDRAVLYTPGDSE